jgi:putative phage-type endonuclease
MDEMKLESDLCVAECRTDNLSEDQFKELRQHGLGGSEAGAIMGLSKYETPMTIVARKLNLIKGFDGNEATKRGKRLEPAIRQFFGQWYEEEFGIPIQVFSSPYFYRSTKYPWLTMNLDGFILHPESGWWDFEIKTGNERQEENWEDDSVPDTYYAQGQHYNVGTGHRGTIYGALVGLNLVIRHVPANPEFQGRMIEAERNIWENFVLKGLLPAPSGHESEDEVLKSMYNDPNEGTVDISSLKEQMAFHIEVSQHIKDLEAEKKRLAAEIKLAVGNAKYGLAPGYKATWSRFETSRFDSERFEKDHKDLLAEYTSKVPSSRFTITAAK